MFPGVGESFVECGTRIERIMCDGTLLGDSNHAQASFPQADLRNQLEADCPKDHMLTYHQAESLNRPLKGSALLLRKALQPLDHGSHSLLNFFSD